MSTVFLKVINLSINATWIILAVILVRLLLKKAPKWISCVLWALVAVRLIVPFSIESVLSLIPSGEVVPADIVTEARPQVNTGVTVINNAVNPVITDTFAPQVGDSANPLQIVVTIASIVWIVGIAGMLTYAFISYLVLRKKVRASVPVGKRIMACDEVKTPFILGVFRPVIYVPSFIGEETLKMVVAHEMAHIKRKDNLWKPLGFLLLSVYWFNPACWVAYILLSRDIESACDEKVIRNKDKKYMAEYSQALLDLSVPRKSIAACPLAFGETGVKGRVKGVLNYKKPAFWIIIVAVVVTVGVAVCFLTNPKRKEEKTETSESIPVSEDIMATEKIQVYFVEGITEERIKEIGEIITSRLEVDNLKYIAAVVAWEEFQSEYIGDESEEFTQNPLNNSMHYEVVLNDYSKQDEFIEYLQGVDGIRKIIPADVDTSKKEKSSAEENTDVQLSDWISEISLPEGYSFGEYIPDSGYEGCFLILPRVYNKGEDSGTPIEWQYSGALTRISADNSQVKIKYKNGIPEEILSMPIHNHTTSEHMSIIGLERSNMQWPAIMLKENHDSTGDYWYFWFVKEGADNYYVLSLSADRFSKEEAIEIAKSVSIKE